MKFTDFSKALSHISVAAGRLKRFEDLSDAEILEFQRMLWDAFGNFRAACNTPKLPNEIKLRLLRAVEAIKRSCKNTQPDNPAAIFWITRISKSETLDDELLEFLWASKEANEYITVTHGFYADVEKTREQLQQDQQAKGFQVGFDEPSKKPTTTETLLQIAGEIPEAKGWSGGDWAKETGIPRSTVTSCKAFKSVEFSNARAIRDARNDLERKS